MKIGFLSVYSFGSSIGGVENHIFFMSRELVRRGHEVIVFQPCAEHSSDAFEEAHIDGVRVVRVFIGKSLLSDFLVRRSGRGLFGIASAFVNKARFLRGWRRVANVIAGFGCDLVHQHDFISSMAVTKRLARSGVCCVLTNHTGEYLFLQKSAIGRRLLPCLLNHFTAIIGPSKELTPGGYHQCVVTIHNGVDLEMFHQNDVPDRSAVRSALGVGADDFVVLCPRRWAPTKGVIYLAKAISNRSCGEKVKFLFAGSDYAAYPKYANEIREALSSAHARSYRLLGNLSVAEMVDAYRASDVVIIPSLMEAVSLSAVEAMASGAVVISTDVGGMPELISDGSNGLLISPADPDQISEAVRRLERDKGLLLRLRGNAAATASKYSWASIAEKTEAVYVAAAQVQVSE
jgi:glycosyltransferase involved in cell wall biosynthesis